MFFVTALDGRRVYILFGPFDSRAGAESYEDTARHMLRTIGGRAHFLPVGVTRAGRTITS